MLIMNAYLASPDQIESWFFNLAEKQMFFFPKKTAGNSYSFERLHFNSHHSKKTETQQQLDLLSYQPTILPPGKKIFTDGEILFTYHKDEQGHYHFSDAAVIQHQILAGVRACDLKGIYLLDAAFSDGIKDIHYLKRREKTDIIAFNCLHPCDDHCFCEAAESLDFQQGADIFITSLLTEEDAGDMDEQFLIEVLSPRGEVLIKTLDSAKCQNPLELKERALDNRPNPFGRQFVAPVAQLQKIIHQEEAENIYQAYAERCFSCGTCNLVCPTCYCFETKDELDLAGLANNSQGKKIRHWDACLNPGFAEVAGGHNFRAEPAARQRHRIRRKFAYLPQRFKQNFCTGCGRCGQQCTTGIDIFDIVNDVCRYVNSLSIKKVEGRMDE